MNTTSTFPGQAAQAASKPVHSTRWALASLSLCMLLPALGTSIANVALPEIAQAFGAPFQQVQWIVLVYLLAITSLIVTAGRLGDTIGRRRLLLAGLVLFTGSSLVCGFAPSLLVLIVARGAQGLGAAVMMSLTLAFVGGTVPREKIGSAMGLLGTMSALGTALGPAIGGLLISALGWHSVFLVNVPLGLLALALSGSHLPNDPFSTPTARSRFDVVGTVILVGTLSAYALAMTFGRGHFGILNALLILGAIAGVIVFSRHASRASSPLIPLEAVRNPTLRAALAVNALVMTVMMATLVVGPFYLSRGLGLGAAHVGMVMSVGPILSAFCGIPAGRMVDRLGGARMAVFSLVAMAAGCAALIVLPPYFGVAGYIASFVLISPAYQQFQASNNTIVMLDVAPDRRGVISGMLNLSRNLGLITGASVMGAVFAMVAGSTNLADSTPASIARGMQVTFAVAAALVVVALAITITARPKPRAG